MLVAGVMSGTSGDGVDVALVDIRGRGWRRRVKLAAFESWPYRARERAAILRAADAAAISVAELARLNVWLGERFAAAVERACRRAGLEPQTLALVASHGQTLYHQGRPQPYLGQRLAATWQAGEPAAIAARLGVPVVANFRALDVALGGQGAPLAPFLDYLMLRSPRRARAALNIGGIANLTLLPAGCPPESVLAFDTGPGNMVLDALAEEFLGRRYDRDGKLAAQGKTHAGLLAELLRDRFYRRPPPKSAGREQYGREFVQRLLRQARRLRLSPADIMATVAELTARTIALGLQWNDHDAGWEIIASGGGVRNRELMRRLERAAPGCRLLNSGEFGLPADAKEAILMAVLGHAAWCKEPGNLPSVTGARRPARLGQLQWT